MGASITNAICLLRTHPSSAALRLLRGGATLAVAADRSCDGSDLAGVCALRAEARHALDQLAHRKPPVWYG